jgi:hypothetical protein
MKTHAKTKSRIGENPLDALLSSTSPKDQSTTARPSTAPSRSARPSKVRATFHLPEELFESVRDAVVALSGPPHRLTLARFAEDALRRELERLQKAESKGKPFPKRESDLRGGRPIGS